MNTTGSKKEYIELWDSHIDTLNILAFTKNKDAEIELRNIIKRLHELVRIIADSKNFKED
jgi:hypothetical protein